MINIKISNKAAYTAIGIFILLSASLAVYGVNYQQSIPNPGHGGDEILVEVNGSEKTLQEAINGDNFGGSVEIFDEYSSDGSDLSKTVNTGEKIEVYFYFYGNQGIYEDGTATLNGWVEVDGERIEKSEANSKTHRQAGTAGTLHDYDQISKEVLIDGLDPGEHTIEVKGTGDIRKSYAKIKIL